MLVTLFLAAFCLAAATLGDAGRGLLRYERAGLERGELWRLFSAHIVHLGWSHTALNVVALLLLAGIFAPFMRALEWLVVMAVAALAIDIGLYVLDAEIAWYVGLSGVLHGLFAAGTLALAARDARFALGLALGLGIKLGIEIVLGPLGATAAMTGGDVVTEAHLYGSVAGAAALGAARMAARRRSSV